MNIFSDSKNGVKNCQTKICGLLYLIINQRVMIISKTYQDIRFQRDFKPMLLYDLTMVPYDAIL